MGKTIINIVEMTLKESLKIKFGAERPEWAEDELVEAMFIYQRYRGIVEEQAYVTRGSVLSCEFGTNPVYMDCIEDHGVYVGSDPLMTCGDCQQSNVHEFGSCMCPETNYAGRLPMSPECWLDGTRAEKAWGNTEAHICMPLINKEQGWQQIDKDVLIESHAHIKEPALLSNAVLVCNYGGIIRIREVPERVETLEEGREETTSRYVVWDNGVRVRADHSLKAEILKKYHASKRVEVITGSNIFEDGEEWVKIKYDDSESGEAWIAYKYLLPDRDIVTTADMFPKEIVQIIDEGHGEVLINQVVQKRWGQAGGYKTFELFKNYNGKDYYNIGVGAKILNPKYPDDGNLQVFDAFSEWIEIEIKNIETGDPRTLNCYRADLKAHTYNHYPDEHKLGAELGIEVTVLDENGERIENGLLQTGIRYPKVIKKNETVDDNEEWVPGTAIGNIVEFCSTHTGDLECEKYELVSITVHLKEEGENVEESV